MGQSRWSRSNVFGWWAARNQNQDLSGNLRHLSPEVPYTTGANGTEAFDFDGVATVTGGVPYPVGNQTFFDIFIGFKVKSITTGNPAQARTAAALVGNSLNVANGLGIALIDLGAGAFPYQFVPYCSNGEVRSPKSIALNTWYVGILSFSGGVLYGSLEPFNYNANAAAPGNVNFGGGSFQLGATTGGSFADVEIEELIVRNPIPVGASLVGDGVIWNYIAGRILRRGDPEEQVRDLITRRAIVAERLAYAPTLGCDFLNTQLGIPMAITHRQVFTDFGPSGVDPSERYESLVIARSLDLDSQTVIVATAERPRVVAYASARADRYGPDMDGSLMVGGRIAQCCPKPGIYFDTLSGTAVELQTSMPKMNRSGWLCETGGGTPNSAFGSAIAAPWTLVSGAARQTYAAGGVDPLFDSANVAPITPQTIFLSDATESVDLAVAAIVAGAPGFWLRCCWLGAGTVEVNSAGVNRHWDWNANGGGGAWVTVVGAITQALPLAAPQSIWQEFSYGWIPADGANAITITWRTATTFRLGYGSASRNMGFTVADQTPGDWAGQEGNLNDDVNRFFFPLVSPFADDGHFRFTFAPKWDYRRIGTTFGKVCLGRITRALTGSAVLVTGDPTPGFIFAYDPVLEQVQLLTSAGAVLCSVSVAGAFVWLPDEPHVISLGWSDSGIEGYAANTVQLFVDTRPSATAAFGGPFAGNAPWIFSAQLATTHAPVPPNGTYQDLLATSRPSDAVRRRVLDSEALL